MWFRQRNRKHQSYVGTDRYARKCCPQHTFLRVSLYEILQDFDRIWVFQLMFSIQKWNSMNSWISLPPEIRKSGAIYTLPLSTVFIQNRQYTIVIRVILQFLAKIYVININLTIINRIDYTSIYVKKFDLIK